MDNIYAQNHRLLLAGQKSSGAGWWKRREDILIDYLLRETGSRPPGRPFGALDKLQDGGPGGATDPLRRGPAGMFLVCPLASAQ